VTATVDRLVQRLPSARVLVALAVAAYGFAYVLPGTGDWLGRDAPIAVVVIGVVYGTVTALGAMALILTYRATRFVNFAYGAMGSLVGVLSIGLYREHGVPYWLALPIGVAGGVVLGALIDILVLRRFKDASRLVVTVASIGLAQVLGGIEVLGSKAVDFVGLTPAFDVPFDVHWDLGVKVLGGDEMLIVLVAPVVLMALAWFLLRTDHGTAVRAAAENTDRAMLLGIPVRRNTTIVWMRPAGWPRSRSSSRRRSPGSPPASPRPAPASSCRRWPPRWWLGWSRCRWRWAPASGSGSSSRWRAGTRAARPPSSTPCSWS
jgi:ribose/xylose/arabinose/galactoside ABC-type transport system permease subunit